MKRILFENARIFDPVTHTFRSGSLGVANGCITALQFSDAVQEEAVRINCGGRRMIPGMVDVHTHGRAGFDFCGADREQVEAMCRAYHAVGTTTVVPTLASAPMQTLMASITLLRDMGFPAIHLEGRYLNPAKRGAHEASLLHHPDAEELSLLLSAAKPSHLHITAALELPGGMPFLQRALSSGATVGLGHSEASYEEATAFLNAGVLSFTHLYNAMPPLHHRNPGMIAAALCRDAYTELICDGLHVAPAIVELTSKMKPTERLVLITDSMSATGCPDGHYAIAGSPVIVRNGRAVTEDGAIAGSTLNLYDGVRNLMRFAHRTLEEALPCATETPADMLSLTDRGRLAIGCRADFCLLREDDSIDEVYCGGIRVGEAE